MTSFSIIKDIQQGLIDSIRFDLVWNKIQTNDKLNNKFRKIIKHNILMFVLPIILLWVIDNLFDVNLSYIYDYSKIIIGTVSGLFHLLYFFDIVDIVCIYANKSNRLINKSNLISLTIIVFFFQMSVYLVMEIINFILNDKFPLVSTIVKFLILTIYHSFYCFNNLWHYKRVDFQSRINIHEKFWPYYFGYAVIVSILYLCSGYKIVTAFYNIYMTVCIIIPFIIKTKYPHQQQSYPSINLKIFCWIVSFIQYIIHYLVN
ncbi:putative etoposide-induced protein 2.4 [Cotonvirus japonicus]|uniref:Etoposide-induced protein 2.4 n=1 Tax=Cotonvirus japonicus TaxID=2811091 RepID=A0ABM7NS84_9VIRU|nr:putative etoposide-induced protein 2.4 [Cotonvirus japonicus]BCS82957.1 putative etoposide-induced protein 2.4 [Cotonvirus japonicus]